MFPILKTPAEGLCIEYREETFDLLCIASSLFYASDLTVGGYQNRRNENIGPMTRRASLEDRDGVFMPAERI